MGAKTGASLGTNQPVVDHAEPRGTEPGSSAGLELCGPGAQPQGEPSGRRPQPSDLPSGRLHRLVNSPPHPQSHAALLLFSTHPLPSPASHEPGSHLCHLHPRILAGAHLSPWGAPSVTPSPVAALAEALSRVSCKLCDSHASEPNSGHRIFNLQEVP